MFFFAGIFFENRTVKIYRTVKKRRTGAGTQSYYRSDASIKNRCVHTKYLQPERRVEKRRDQRKNRPQNEMRNAFPDRFRTPEADDYSRSLSQSGNHPNSRGRKKPGDSLPPPEVRLSLPVTRLPPPEVCLSLPITRLPPPEVPLSPPITRLPPPEVRLSLPVTRLYLPAGKPDGRNCGNKCTLDLFAEELPQLRKR